MTKEQLVEKISSANVPDDLKKGLLDAVEAAPAVDGALSEKLRGKIQEAAATLTGEIESDRIDEATAELDEATAEIGKDIDSLSVDIGKQADEVDMGAARAQIEKN